MYRSPALVYPPKRCTGHSWTIRGHDLVLMLIGASPNLSGLALWFLSSPSGIERWALGSRHAVVLACCRAGGREHPGGNILER